MKYYLTFVLISIFLFGKAQEISVEKSIYGVQTGFSGIWVYNELRLSNSIALRSELGLDNGRFRNIGRPSNASEDVRLLTPVLTLEPRFYYNLEKRKSKSKKIESNSGEFFSINTSFHPDWFVISNKSEITKINIISIIPMWGLRRHIGKHFNYEGAIGLGYVFSFAKEAGFAKNESEFALDLHLRIGYTF